MSTSIPEGFTSTVVDCGEVMLHLVHNGRNTALPLDDDRTPILFLHGFPEYWVAWADVFTRLSDDFLILAPDQRGYNRSDAPVGMENYAAKLLVQDVVTLVAKTLGGRRIVLAGHDWGASIAYALAMAIPAQISHLIIANGVHPVCFQEALLDDRAQAAASQYFHVLRAQNAGAHMAAEDFRRAFSMFEKFSHAPWLTPEKKAAYRAAWKDETRMQAMVNWYNSSPILVPREGELVPERTLYGAPRDKFRIDMPHLLLWGQNDTALLPSSYAKLGEFCDDLTVRELAHGDHWLLHSDADWVANEMRSYLR